jgi:hypothetical protein
MFLQYLCCGVWAPVVTQSEKMSPIRDKNKTSFGQSGPRYSKNGGNGHWRRLIASIPLLVVHF